MRYLCVYSVLFLGNVFAEEGYVSVELKGQFGNQLFEIATAYAYSLDHNLTLTIPDLIHQKGNNVPLNAARVFLSKFNCYDVPVSFDLNFCEPSFNYASIPFAKTVSLHGHFQSEKYFKHRRDEILSLFAPPEDLEDQIFANYPSLQTDAFVVGVQIRDYRKEFPRGDHHPTIGSDYYKKAMSRFPSNTIFLVASNNIKYARDCTRGINRNIIYLRDTGNYIEQFYTLSFFIISNSTFGWWAAWLAKDPNKVVIVPDPWFAWPYDNKVMTRDLFPKEWTIITCKDINKIR